MTATFSICGWAVLYRFGAEIGPPTFSAFSFGAHMTATFLLALLVGFGVMALIFRLAGGG